MKAQVLSKPAGVETAPLSLQEAARPKPAAGEITVQIHVCGVCHTDLHVVEGEAAAPRPAVDPRT